MLSASLGYLLVSPAFDHAFFTILGILISVYSLYVEMRKSKDPTYVAMCDFNDRMNCSKVLTSDYSKGFGLTSLLFGKESMMNIPNCSLGIVFFSAQFILGFLHHPWATAFLYYSSILSCLGSIYLAYILFMILNDVCLVCLATYATNAALMYLNYQIYHYA